MLAEVRETRNARARRQRFHRKILIARKIARERNRSRRKYGRDGRGISQVSARRRASTRSYLNQPFSPRPSPADVFSPWTFAARSRRSLSLSCRRSSLTVPVRHPPTMRAVAGARAPGLVLRRAELRVPQGAQLQAEESQAPHPGAAARSAVPEGEHRARERAREVRPEALVRQERRRALVGPGALAALQRAPGARMGDVAEAAGVAEARQRAAPAAEGRSC